MAREYDARFCVADGCLAVAMLSGVVVLCHAVVWRGDVVHDDVLCGEGGLKGLLREAAGGRGGD